MSYIRECLTFFDQNICIWLVPSLSHWQFSHSLAFQLYHVTTWVPEVGVFTFKFSHSLLFQLSHVTTWISEVCLYLQNHHYRVHRHFFFLFHALARWGEDRYNEYGEDKSWLPVTDEEISFCLTRQFLRAFAFSSDIFEALYVSCSHDLLP